MRVTRWTAKRGSAPGLSQTRRLQPGEIIPGIQLSEGAPTLSLSQLDKTAFPLILAAIRAGDLSIEVLPQLTQGEN